MNRQQYESLLNNSNVRKMLDLIAQTEGVKWGYNTLFGNQKIDNLSAHPNLKKQFKQTDGKINYTTAAGRYQFIKPTWDGLVDQLGLKDFSPRSQDIGAIALLAENGALPFVLKGDYRTAVRKSGGTWASLPSSSYAQPKRGWDFVDKQLGTKSPQQAISGVVGQPQQELQRNFVDLNALRSKQQQQELQRNFVNLNALRSGQPQQELQRNFVDLNQLRNSQGV